MAEAELWIASNASVLNLRLVAIASATVVAQLSQISLAVSQPILAEMAGVLVRTLHALTHPDISCADDTLGLPRMFVAS
jgi:hypothetical protein